MEKLRKVEKNITTVFEENWFQSVLGATRDHKCTEGGNVGIVIANRSEISLGNISPAILC